MATDIKNDPLLSIGLVSYFEMEEASGTRFDSHGSNDLADNNTVLSAPGVIGNGADFETTQNEWLSITDAAQSGLNFAGDFSVSMWVKLESTGTGMLFAKDNFHGSKQSYHVYTNGGDVFGRFSDDGTNNTGHVTNMLAYSVNMTVGTLAHIVVTYDASLGVARVYKDGVYTATTMSGTIGGTLYASPEDFTIGRRELNTPAWYFDGIIDEVGIWSKILSDAEILDIYNSGAGLIYDAGGAGGTTANNPMAMASF